MYGHVWQVIVPSHGVIYSTEREGGNVTSHGSVVVATVEQASVEPHRKVRIFRAPCYEKCLEEK